MVPIHFQKIHRLLTTRRLHTYSKMPLGLTAIDWLVFYPNLHFFVESRTLNSHSFILNFLLSFHCCYLMLEAEPQGIPPCTAGLATFTYSSDLTDLPYSTDYDINEQIPQTIFSQYYSVSEFTSIQCNGQDFSTLHSSIRSLSLYCDDIVNL